MLRLVPVALLLSLAACSSTTATPETGDASTADSGVLDSSADSSLDGGDAEMETGSSSGCRPTGAACADNPIACCSLSCTAEVDLDNVVTSHCN
jgi:hypothetical protein